MNSYNMPETIPNWINGEEIAADSGATFGKLSPHSGEKLYRVARSNGQDVKTAIQAARKAQAGWAEITPVQRGDILYDITLAMRKYREEIATIVAAETGMSFQAALAETGGAIAQGEFMAGEGRRFYGRTTTSAVTNKYAQTVRQPLGVA
ncbi:MAG: aldehyde dehydrogenase family protein, partial [Desulfobacterales bacterium]